MKGFLLIQFLLIIILIERKSKLDIEYHTTRQAFNRMQNQKIRNALCVYPFDSFLTAFDEDKYLECVEKTKLLNEQDATSFSNAKSFYINHYFPKTPQHFESWYYFAKRRNCRINRYDGLHKQLLPFKKGTFSYSHLRNLVALFNNTQLTTFTSKNGVTHIEVNSERAAAYIPVFSRLQKYLPDFQFVINTHAQPVVLFNKHYGDHKVETKLNQYQVGLGQAELTIRSNNSNKTKIKRFSDIIANACQPDEYRSSLMQGYGLFMNTPEEYLTTKLLPMLSWGNYPGCTKDILIPSVFHYGSVPRSVVKPSYYTEWKYKYPSLIWRGATSGSPFYLQEYRNYLPDHVCTSNCTRDQIKLLQPLNYNQQVWFWSHRQRAAAYALEYPSLLNVYLVDAVEMHDTLRKQVFKFHKRAYRLSFKRFFDYKFILDIDGNGYSSRFLTLLHSNSLIFAAHYAEDWFTDIAIPFYHYIPINIGFTQVDVDAIPLDFKKKLLNMKQFNSDFKYELKQQNDTINTPLGYNDLAPKVLFYQQYDELSEKIALQGQKLAQTRLRDEDMDCYLYRVVIELYDILHHNDSLV